VEAIIQSIRSERDEMIQQWVENIVMCVIHETPSLQKACLETTACHETEKETADTEKTEPDPGMMRCIEEYQQIPKGEAAVIPIRGLRKRRRVRNLAAERRQKMKESTRRYCGSRKRVTVSSRRNVSRRAGVAWRKRKLCKKIEAHENCGPCKELAAARIKTTRCVKVARGREHWLQKQGKDDIALRIRK
jgi:hypothetical protein